MILFLRTLLGGVGCGSGFPNWYARIAHYEKWISCILEKTDKQNFEKVSKICRHIRDRRCQNNIDIYDCLHGGNDEDILSTSRCEEDTPIISYEDFIGLDVR